MNLYPELKPTESSLFSEAGYRESTWDLLLRFRSTGELRAYRNVCPEIADEALSAKSLGTWWNSTVKANGAWEFEVLEVGKAPEPSPKKADKPKDAKKPPVADMGITADDIRVVDPSYVGDDEINPLFGLPAFEPEGAGEIAATYGGIDRKQTMIHMSEVGNWPTGDKGYINDPLPPIGDNPGIDELYQKYPATDQEAFQASEIATIPTAELLGKWTAPESAAEALELLSERETEIEAIIASCKAAGESALTVTVKDAEGRVKAGEVLNDLVKKKDTATELLEPFRKILHEAYQYAGGKKSAALDPLDTAIKQVKQRCLAWEDEQKRIKAEADKKAREAADAEARRLQEEERQRLVLADVQDAIDDGDEQKAQELFDRPMEVPRRYVPPLYIPSAAPVVEGQSSSQKFKVDESPLETPEGYLDTVMTLLRAVKDDKVELRLAATYLRWDLVALNKLAGALKTAFFVPGLSAKPVSNMSVRRK